MAGRGSEVRKSSGELGGAEGMEDRAADSVNERRSLAMSRVAWRASMAASNKEFVGARSSYCRNQALFAQYGHIPANKSAAQTEAQQRPTSPPPSTS